MSNKKRTRTEITEEKKRRAIHLRNQGWFYRDIARDTGIPQHTIETCWKRWASDLGVAIITHGDDEDKPVEMPVTVSYTDPLPPINKRKEPVRPYTPSVIESTIRQRRSEQNPDTDEAVQPEVAEESSVSAGTPVSATPEVSSDTVEAVIAPDPLGSFQVVPVEVQAPREIPEAEAVQEEAEVPAAKKKGAASVRKERRGGQKNPPAGRKTPDPKPDLRRIYDLIGLINEAVVDYAIEMMVLPEQIGQNIEVADGIMTMVLSVPVGGMDR